MMDAVILYGTAFLAMLVLDVAYARYTLATAALSTMRASCWASLITVCNGVVVLSYVHDWRTLVAAVAGAFAGTYIAAR